MNRLPENGSVSRPLFTPVKFQDFDVSWAGPNPLGPGFCFGSEDGRLMFTDESGALSPAFEVSAEAINGVASIQQWIAVTTRSEVTFIKNLDIDADERDTAEVPAGAHGIATTESGNFVAPLGLSGFMVVKPANSSVRSAEFRNTLASARSFYAAICLRDNGGQELLAFANRLNGVSVMEFSGSEEPARLNGFSFDGLDIVDLCELQPGSDSLAVGALAKDGTLVLFQDVRSDKTPAIIKFDSVKGVAYRLLSWREHIFLLTSKGLYVLAKLAGKIAAGESLSGAIVPVLELPMEAVDANLSGDRWLLVVMSDEIRRYDLGLIHESVPSFTPQESRSLQLLPTRGSCPLEHSSRAILAVTG